MPKCYNCNCELTNQNNSSEHIIPNVLRGRLKSKNILCRKCNSNLAIIDKKLADNFEFFNIFLATKTNRKINLKVLAKVDERNVFLKQGLKFNIPFKPQITKKENKIDLKFEGMFASNDPKEKNKFYKNIQECLKGYGKSISLDEIKKISKITEKIPKITNTITIDLASIILGYLKIALGFCAFKNKLECVEQDIFHFFKHFDLNKFECFIRIIDVDKFKNGRLCNHLYLIGDKKNSKLFCALSIFNYLDIAIILNDNYKGENFQENYIFDLMKSEEVKEYVDFSFSEIENNKFNIEKIRKYSQINAEYIMDFFMYRNLSEIPNMLWDLIDYICFTNINILTQEELKIFTKNAFAKASEKQFINLNIYHIEKIPEIFNQENLYNFYEQKHLCFNQLFNSDKIKPYLELLENQSKWTQNEIRIFVMYNQILHNKWTKIIDEIKQNQTA